MIQSQYGSLPGLISLVGRVLYLACRKFCILVLYKKGLGDPRLQSQRSGRRVRRIRSSEVQGHPWLQSKFKGSLGRVRFLSQQEERELHLRGSCAFSKGEGGRAGGSKHSLKDLLLLEGSSSSWCLDYKVTLSAFSNKWSHQVLRVNRTLADHSVTIFYLHRISVLARGCLLTASRKKNRWLCSRSFYSKQ